MSALHHFDLITLFPDMVEGFLHSSILARAQKNNLLSVRTHNLRDFSELPHNQVDDRPFGGGPGMVLMPDPLFQAIESLKTPDSHIIYLCPDGIPLSTPLAASLATKPHLILISGHYEGIDERVRSALVHQEVSIGDYVLTNGTLPAAVLIDAVARHIPGVLGEEKSLTHDSFRDNLLSFPQYTRPADFRGVKVPDVLLSGDHQAIAMWRKQQQLSKTQQRRPDLLQD